MRLRIEGDGVPPYGKTRVIDLDTGKPIENVCRVVIDIGVNDVPRVTLEVTRFEPPQLSLDLADAAVKFVDRHADKAEAIARLAADIATFPNPPIDEAIEKLRAELPPCEPTR